jgi:tetratricopeptide (TPR) repeat protein
MTKFYFLLALFIAYSGVQAQNDASYKETYKTYTTYPFSDPDPIPSTKMIYPYFRFDGFTDEPVEKEWKVVILENDYISVQIMPEIGGKVWTAMEKTSGKHFLYNNEVVKFRDIAMRGPWVSGGIEANYGIIGHTPNTSTPVDYLVRSNKDGSVSCFTSTLDLLTRTRWVLEIKVEKDKAYFSTRSFWFNSSGYEQPYYTWMNAGIPVGKNLKFLYPGSHYIGHDGESASWPEDPSGRDLSYYDQNKFGGSKSYHVLGTPDHYFGALWEKEDFGMIHYSRREDKLGKKIFLWAQSEEGRIWEDLLTDNSGQYVEIQSGRLFNQNDFQSSLTPFKQVGFNPYSSENWTEYWYPFGGMEGFTDANLIGAFKIGESGDQFSVQISPVQSINDSLLVYNPQGKIIASAFVEAKPLHPIHIKVELPAGERASKIRIHGNTLQLDKGKPLSRPLEIPEEFEEESAYGLYLQGRDLGRFREYERAKTKIQASLEKEPLFIPALVEMAKLKLFQLQYDSAFYYSQKALSIDTYHGEANYYYGMAASKLHQNEDALDGFGVATLSSPYRHAAYCALSHEYMKAKDLLKAEEYARLALKGNSENLDALQILYLLARIKQDNHMMSEMAERIEELNPLLHFLNFENFFQSPTPENKNKFIGQIQNEMPVETFLELAIWYSNLGRGEESLTLLDLAPQNTETLYWQAWLNRELNHSFSNEFLKKAALTSPDFVFPFREETAEVLEWASKEGKSWQANYLLALILDFRGNRKEALEALEKYPQDIDFAPFYMLRARLYDQNALDLKLRDVRHAAEISPEEWRYPLIQSGLLVQLQRQEEAIQVLKNYYSTHQDNYIVGMDLTKMLIKNNEYKEADRILSTLHVLPFEGATDARRLYRETKLMLSHLALEEGDFSQALKKIEEAEEWPARLGVGKPFPESIDESLENFMRFLIHQKSGKKEESQAYLSKVKKSGIDENNYIERIKDITSRVDKRMF